MSTRHWDASWMHLVPTCSSTGEGPGCSLSRRFRDSTRSSVRAWIGRSTWRGCSDGLSSGRLISMQTSFGRLLSQIEPALDADHGVLGQQVTDVGHGPGEDPHLDVGHQVLQEEGRHQLAPLGVLAGHAGHHSADPAQLALPAAVPQFGDGGIDVPGEGRLHPLERVVAQVEAEHLLLERQPDPLGEVLVGDRHPGLVEHRILPARVPEQAHDPLVGLAAAGQGPIDDLLEHQAQALTGVAEGVEGTGLDERFDRCAC